MDRALLIGIDEYEHETHLHGCVNDVAAVESFLIRNCGFAPSAIEVVTQADAKRACLVKKLEKLAAATKPGDRVVLYFAGHGAQYPTIDPETEEDHLDELICPVDFDATAGNGIRDREFRWMFKYLPADAEFVWIADSCSAGDLALTTRGIALPVDLRERVDAARDKGMRPLGFAGAAEELNLALLAACAPDGVAHETMVGGICRGLFTDTLLRRLMLADGFTAPVRSIIADVRQEIGCDQQPDVYGAAARLNAPFPGDPRSIVASSALPQTGAVQAPSRVDFAAKEESNMRNVTKVKTPVCSALFSATRIDNGVVVLTARGEHYDSGYSVHFEAADNEPGAYFLLHRAPQKRDGVKEPFLVPVPLTNVDPKAKSVRIYDSRGHLDVPIDPRPDPSPLSDASMALEGGIRSIRGGHARPRVRRDDENSTGNCRNCVIRVIERWANHEIISTMVTLEDLRGPAGCDSEALVDLADRLTVAGCGDELRGTPLACDETVASVIAKVC